MTPTFANAAAIALIFLAPAALAQEPLREPAQESALDECWSRSDNRIEMGECLRALQSDADEALAESFARALEAQVEVDGIVGQRQASRTLQRAQTAFELYRDLNCHLRELQAGSGTGAGDFFLGCWIDMTRERTAELEELAPERDQTLSVLGTWSVESLEGGKVMPGTELTLVVENEDSVAGDGGCNRFFGPLELEPMTGPEGRIEIGPLGATRKACGDMIDEQEMRFLGALGDAERFALTGDKLSLSDSTGEILLRLTLSP